MKALSNIITQPSTQLADSTGKKYPTLQSAGAKVFVQATAPSGAGEVNGDIWIQIP